MKEIRNNRSVFAYKCFLIIDINMERYCYAREYYIKYVENAMIISKILTTFPDIFKHFASAQDCSPAAEKTLTNLIAKFLAEENRLNTFKKKKNLWPSKSQRKNKKKEIKIIK